MPSIPAVFREITPADWTLLIAIIGCVICGVYTARSHGRKRLLWVLLWLVIAIGNIILQQALTRRP